MKWLPKSVDAAQVQHLADYLRTSPALTAPTLSPTLARLLVMRGIAEPNAAEMFLKASLTDLHSPYLMMGMKTAIERIEAAIECKEGMLIYGDYDVDGTTAIVILKTAIELCGGTAEFHVPHRIKEGYDLRGDVIERAAAAGIRLVISVDSGTRAFAAAESARRAGVDLIITDHHLPGPEGLPHAYAVVNPNQMGCEYPCKLLCGAGIAFKIAQALIARRLPHRDQAQLLLSFMKIAAIATVADSVPLLGENRVIASLGLQALRRAVNPGLKALLDVAQLGGKALTSEEVAFRIAPRVNAAGRMDIAATVIDLFTTKDADQAREIAVRLDKLNSDRQEEERRIMSQIEDRLAQDAVLRDSYCMVIDGDGWHRGVIGITATRVVERYGRPALVITRDGDEAHGSGRSISAFHLLNALESCPKLFTRFGGHAHAVGFALPSDRIPELRASVDAFARTQLTAADFEPILRIDGELTLDEVTPDLFNAVKQLEPFGMGNPEPVFAVHNARLLLPPRLLKDAHVKFKLAPPQKTGKFVPGFEAVGWRMAELLAQQQLLAGDTVDVAFTLDHNDHPEFGGLQLCLSDFVKTSVQAASTTA